MKDLKMMSTTTTAVQAVKNRRLMWDMAKKAKKAYELAKGKSKEIIPDFKDVVDAIKGFLKKEPIANPSPDPSPPTPISPPDPSPPTPISPPDPSPFSLHHLIGVILLLVLVLIALAGHRDRCATSTFGLGNRQKLLNKSRTNFDFVGIFGDLEQYKGVLVALRDHFVDSAVTDELCRQFIDGMGTQFSSDFIGGMVSDGRLYLASRGRYRFVIGHTDPVDDILPTDLVRALHMDYETTVFPITQFHHFIVMCSDTISEAFQDADLVNLVSMTQDKRNVAKEIVRGACIRRPALAEMHAAAVIFFD